MHLIDIFYNVVKQQTELDVPGFNNIRYCSLVSSYNTLIDT